MILIQEGFLLRFLGWQLILSSPLSSAEHALVCVKINARQTESWKNLCNPFFQVVVNNQSSEVHEINAGIPKGSLLSSTLFPLSRNVLRSLVTIYADDVSLWKHFQKSR